MLEFGADKVREEILLLARILLVVLFLVFGWAKVTNFGATVGYFEHDGLPLPAVAAIIAVIMELLVGVAIVLGVFTRPLALLLAVYTLATAFIGHAFWSMTGPAQMANEINFFKNVSIIGGLLLLYVAGPGRYSIDARILPGAAQPSRTIA